jgi:adenosylcobinamide kinase/adenosylcobinamide-phosphate guanylyltransferase
MPVTFVTGPVRSGKSRFAERLARERGGDVVYVATARVDPDDAEWVARIAHHAARRPAAWRVVETAAAGAAPAGTTLLVDSLGTWLAEAMSRALETSGETAALDAAALEADLTAVARALLASPAHAIVVGEEVGWGLVPAYPAGRVFRDVLGRVQQELAQGAARAYLVVAGFALDLTAQGEPIER